MADLDANNDVGIKITKAKAMTKNRLNVSTMPILTCEKTMASGIHIYLFY